MESPTIVFAINGFSQAGQVLVAACDPDLLGNSFEEGEIQLDVRSDFYDGDRVDETTLKNRLSVCTIANLVGPKTIAVAISMGLIEQDNVATVEGIPHAQFMAI